MEAVGWGETQATLRCVEQELTRQSRMEALGMALPAENYHALAGGRMKGRQMRSIMGPMAKRRVNKAGIISYYRRISGISQALGWVGRGLYPKEMAGLNLVRAVVARALRPRKRPPLGGEDGGRIRAKLSALTDSATAPSGPKPDSGDQA